MACERRPVAAVTGCAGGIGRAIAEALAREGFCVLLHDRDEPDTRERLADLASTIVSRGGDATVYACDIAELDTHAGLLGAAYARWGRLDCLVNNAGVSVKVRGDLLDAAADSYDRVMAVNARALFFLCQQAARLLIAQGEIAGQHRSLVLITSSNAEAVSIARGEYCMSKAAASMAARLFALRLADTGIGVYDVRPGIIETEMTRPSKAKYDALIADGLVPARRWGQPEDVATVVASVACGRLPYTVGQPIVVDGGLTMPRF